MRSVGQGRDAVHQLHIADAPLPPGHRRSAAQTRNAGGNLCVGHASYDFHRQIADAFLSRARSRPSSNSNAPGNLPPSHKRAAYSHATCARGSLGVVHSPSDTHGSSDDANTFAQSKISALSKRAPTEHSLPRPKAGRTPRSRRRGILRRRHIRDAHLLFRHRVGELLAALHSDIDCRSKAETRAA